MGEDIPTVDPDDEQKPTVAIRTNSLRQKAEWERSVATSDEYHSLTHLIRKAVGRELAGAYDAESGDSSVGRDERVGDILTAVEGMQGRLNDLEESLADATRAMQSGGVSEETTTAVWAALPTAPERATNAEGVAEGLDMDADTARVALEHLAENAPVKKREIQQIEESGGTVTVTDHTGREIEIEDPGQGVKRRNPLWWRET